MSENNIETTVAASDDRVILYIDIEKMVSASLSELFDVVLEIGCFLGEQGIKDVKLEPKYLPMLGLELSADDAMIVKLRFPIVPDSLIADWQALGHRFEQTTRITPTATPFMMGAKR